MERKLPIPIVDTIKKRHSVRTFTGQPLSAEDRRKLTDFIKDAGDYAVCLEMLRLAPSAKNQQPWRVLKQGNIYHFYETHSATSSPDEAKIKQVDLEIALSHFHQTALEQGLSGRFEKLPQDRISIPNSTWYGISWVIES